MASGIQINSNIASISAQRRLADSTNRLEQVYSRLSSGFRINSAKDDAAGLAIAESLNLDNRVFTQAVRNINDGLSALSIAEGAMEELSSIVIRIRELATQSANGALSNNQRQAIDKEAQELSSEFTRIQQSTAFNTLKLLNGSTDSIRIQAGYGDGGGIISGVGKYLGDGTINSSGSFSAGFGGNSVVAGDFNGDGIIDLVATNQASGTISIMLGLGDGSFQAPTAYTVGPQPYQVIAGDFTGNGVLDLAIMNAGNATASVLLGKGDGTFADQNIISLFGPGSSIAAADFNGDGILDLVTNDIMNTVEVRLGNGDGTFGPASGFSLGVVDSALFLQVGDLDGDGNVDILSANMGTGDISVLLGNGDGTFGAATIFSAGGSMPNKVALGDLDGDGILDLVVTDIGSNHVRIHHGNGDGTFRLGEAYTLSSPQDVQLGDLNGDGILDIVVGLHNNGVSVLLGDGNGTFSSPVNYSTGFQTYGVALGDFNGDGVVDVAAGGQNQVSSMLGGKRDGIAPILPFDLSNRAGALQALAPLDTKLQILNIQRGTVGAFQSRLSVANSVLQVSAENFKSAESRIKDADIAAESAELVRTNILQQAGSSVLAQANIQPSIALRLLAFE